MESLSSANSDHKQLLFNLKSVIETIFLNNVCVEINETNLISATLGALPKLHLIIEKLFIHGIRIYKPDGTPHIWHFIEGLNWLNPALSTTIGSSTPTRSAHVPSTRIKNNTALLWIYENLLNLSLSTKLIWLISDYEHLSNCYEVTAFLRNEKYTNAMILCLQSIEKNQYNLLSQIDSNLYQNNSNDTKSSHKRSSSHPDFSLSLLKPTSGFYNKKSLSPSQLPKSIKNSFKTSNQNRLDKKFNKIQTRNNNREIVNLKLRPWFSLPNLDIDLSSKVRLRSQTLSQPISIPNSVKIKNRLTSENLNKFNNNSLNDSNKFSQTTVPSFSYKQLQSDSGGSSGYSKTDLLKPITLLKCDDIEIHFDRKQLIKSNLDSGNLNEYDNKVTSTTESANITQGVKSVNSDKGSIFPSLVYDSDYLHALGYEIGESSVSTNNLKSFFSKSAPSDFVNTFLPQSGVKLKQSHKINPLLSDDGCLSFPSSSGRGYFPRPIQGQSLASFLQTAQFSRTNTELDRENAHFSVAEAMISAIEQLKWTRFEKQKLKQKYKSSWSESGDDKNYEIVKQKKSRKKRKLKNSDYEQTENLKQNVSSLSATSDGISQISDDSEDTINISSNLSSDNEIENLKIGNPTYLTTLNVSTHNVNDHTAYAEWGENSIDALSAEGVALSLISKFSDKQLPTASELLWLVSEQDAPQQLLPMPGSWSVNPDEKCYSFLRGTRDWAPPRAQIIFTKHPAPHRKKIIQFQNQRCAGCGMRVATPFSNCFRYCEYLGKYLCTGCHRNQVTKIPARILHDWDFTNCSVSVFSYRLLNEIWCSPLFRVCDLNPKLYDKVKNLKLTHYKRLQLKFIKDFIFLCRFDVDNVKSLFTNIPNHITDDVEIWSMADFIAVKNGLMVKSIKNLITKCESHINKCDLCRARGFLCELCPNKKQIIFPWQKKVKRCNQCGVCYHETCWQNVKQCTKCLRLEKRQQKL